MIAIRSRESNNTTFHSNLFFIKYKNKPMKEYN
jgi:hypothetical protein